MPAPKVSVVIPSYNYAHYLDETIQSVLGQTYEDYELIIVDNHSVDNTTEVVAKYLVDHRITYVRNETNLGVAGNFNRCLELASGELIKFLCADDKFHPLLLEKYVAIMDQFPQVSLITCDKQGFGAIDRYFKMPLQHLQSGKKVIGHTLRTYPWIGEPTSVMFRRKNLHLGGFTTKYWGLTDWDMWIKQLTVGDCYIVPEPLAMVRDHTQQVTKEIVRTNHFECFDAYDICKRIKEQDGFQVDLSEEKIEDVLKRRATDIARKVMLRQVKRLHKKHFRSAFFRAFRIAFAEKVITSALLESVKGFRKKTVVSLQS